MGAIVYSTGGILIDDGWIRILGSGSDRLPRSLPEWNKGKTMADYGGHSPFYLVADDAIGGFFAINGGGLGNDPGKVYHLSPDNLEWEAMGLSYSEFLQFCFSGDLEKYYSGNRWKNWRKEVLRRLPEIKHTIFILPYGRKKEKTLRGCREKRCLPRSSIVLPWKRESSWELNSRTAKMP